MAKILEMPKLSPTMEEGVLSAWHKKAGDTIEVDDLLAEVETDKATMEFRAFDRGTILELLVAAGAVVKLGQPVAIVGNAGEDVSALRESAGASAASPAAPEAEAATKADAAPAAEAPKEGDPPGADLDPAKADAETPMPKEGAPTDDATTPKAKAPAEAKAATPTAKAAPIKRKGSLLDRTEYPADDEPSPGQALASPYVRKLARDRGIELEKAQGSGKHGRVLPEDLDAVAKPGPQGATPTAALARPSAGAAPALSAVSALSAPEARPLSPMRKTIARRLVESKRNVPHFYLTIDVDADPLVSLREDVNEKLAAGGGARKEGDPPAPKVSVNDFLVKAVALALVKVPECNAQYTDEALLVHTRVDISVAVAVPDGLVTPVVRNANTLSVLAISQQIRELARRARVKKLRPEEMSDGTFSISNLGMFGIDTFSAVINPPEGAILAVGRVRDEAVVKDGQLAVGKRLGLTLSCDHRVIDGAIGAAFLAELRALVENPMLVLAG